MGTDSWSPFPLFESGFTESIDEVYESYLADCQEGDFQVHGPCSPSQTQPLADQHHEEPAPGPAPEPARDEDIIALAGDNCMQSTLFRPAFPTDKEPCDQLRTKNEPSRYKGRRGRSGEGIIGEKIPRSPRKRHGKRPRSRNWDHNEVASLLKLKLSASNSVNRTTDWESISRMLKEDSSITRSAKECENLWGTARRRWRDLEEELKSSNINPGDQSGGKMFWEEKGGNTFNLECYEIMSKILSKGTRKNRLVKQKAPSPASTSRAPRASTTSTSESLGNSEGHGNVQRPGSSTQLDNPTDGLVRLLAEGGQKLTYEQIIKVKELNIKEKELQIELLKTANLAHKRRKRKAK